MRKAKFVSRVQADPSWLHWMATIPLLAGRHIGIPFSLEAVGGTRVLLADAGVTNKPPAS